VKINAGFRTVHWSTRMYVLEYPDWISVFGLTLKREVVLVKLYRHGTGKTLLELPSGKVDEQDESPLETAKRELLEETGYTTPIAQFTPFFDCFKPFGRWV